MKLNYKILVAVIYTVVLFLDRLDLTIVNVTLPTVARFFSISIVATDWISISFLLALAISIPISSWLGDRFGLKRIYIIAMFLFGVGSTCCAFANSLNQLILLRFVQGVGGGMLIPIGMTLIYRVYSKLEYASITSFTFLPSLIAPAIGPFLGGILLNFLGWRFVFLFAGPICLILAMTAAILLKEEEHKSKYPLDWAGFLLSTIILMGVFYDLSMLGRNGLSLGVLILFFVLIPLTSLFIRIERQKQHPLVNLSFFKHGVFMRANLIQLCFQTCHFGAIFLVSLFLQVGIGFSAVVAGLIMGMQAVGAMAVSRYSVRLFNRYGAKLPIVIGLGGVAICSPMIMLINKPNLLILGVILFFIRGLFSGLCGTPIQTLSVIGFEKKEMGSVNSIFNACRQISISFGVAISSLLISLGFHYAGLNESIHIPMQKVFLVFGFGFWAISVIALIGVAITWGLKQSL